MTSSSTNTMAVGVEGHPTNRPPIFNGSNYPFWSNRMSIFMRSYDYEMWDVVLDGLYLPMKTCTRVEASKRMVRIWSEKSISNFKAINTLHCTLNPTEFNRISTCKIVKEIWDKLKVTHEGTSQVKESKIALLSNQYEMFKMQANESITSWFDWYTTIVNQLNQLGRVIPKDEMVKKLLRSLLESLRSTVIAIREAKDLNKILLDEICGSLLIYE